MIKNIQVVYFIGRIRNWQIGERKEEEKKRDRLIDIFYDSTIETDRPDSKI